MRKFLLLTFLIFYSMALSAQCTADAGPDQHICPGDTIVLGGNPTASGGAAPYTYNWSFHYSMGTLNYYASHFLSDTTAADPRMWDGLATEMEFVLEVTDANNQSCFDTVYINNSVFVSHLGSYSMSIQKGDTVSLPFGPNLSSNDSIVQYLWRPQHGMVDSIGLYPVVAPVKSMDYYVVATDIHGCTVAGAPFVYVEVDEFGRDEVRLLHDIKIYPNPASDELRLSLPAGLKMPLEVGITDLSGRIVESFTTSTPTSSHPLSLNEGLYLLQVLQDSKVIKSQKLIISK